MSQVNARNTKSKKNKTYQSLAQHFFLSRTTQTKSSEDFNLIKPFKTFYSPTHSNEIRFLLSSKEIVDSNRRRVPQEKNRKSLMYSKNKYNKRLKAVCLKSELVWNSMKVSEIHTKISDFTHIMRKDVFELFVNQRFIVCLKSILDRISDTYCMLTNSTPDF